MSRRASKELETRNDDLVGAISTIGRIVEDAAITPKARLQRVAGIVQMYAPKAEAEK